MTTEVSIALLRVAVYDRGLWDFARDALMYWSVREDPESLRIWTAGVSERDAYDALGIEGVHRGNCWVEPAESGGNT